MIQHTKHFELQYEPFHVIVMFDGFPLHNKNGRSIATIDIGLKEDYGTINQVEILTKWKLKLARFGKRIVY